jgi:hypothetical protein
LVGTSLGSDGRERFFVPDRIRQPGERIRDDGPVSGPATHDLQMIADFLARRDVPSLDPDDVGRTFDVLVLCGSAVLESADVAARAVRDGVAGRILVTGGVGHSTRHLAVAVREHPAYSGTPTDGRPEADVLAEILRRHLGVPPGAILTEVASTNCGENAANSLRLLAGGTARSILLVQDPTMQRRTHAAFDLHRRRTHARIEVVSHAPFLPLVRADDVAGSDGRAAWTRNRFTSLALGEVRRLRDDEDGYGPRGAGFIAHVDVPTPVLTAYARLRDSVPGRLRDR